MSVTPPLRFCLARHCTVLALTSLAVCLSVTSAAAQGRTQIRIVGSSTVYPFSSYVAEDFGKTTRNSTPVVESTGSGGGHKLFAEGVGTRTPDITNSSRRMKASEYKLAMENGVESITEAIIGFDGIVVAQNARSKPLDLTRLQLTLAVAAEVPQSGKLVTNPYKFWDQVDSKLPHRKIVVYGPPTTSGTRDAFEELCMEPVTEDHAVYKGAYTKIRQDGAYVPAGENDNLIVQRLAKDPNALGIFGYSFLEENKDKIQGSKIDGVEPTPKMISSGKYSLSRSLYFYIKNDHVGTVPGIKEFVELFMHEKMIGDYGYLRRIGLIPLPKDVRAAARKRVLAQSKLKLTDSGELSSVQDFMKGQE